MTDRSASQSTWRSVQSSDRRLSGQHCLHATLKQHPSTAPAVPQDLSGFLHTPHLTCAAHMKHMTVAKVSNGFVQAALQQLRVAVWILGRPGHSLQHFS